MQLSKKSLFVYGLFYFIFSTTVSAQIHILYDTHYSITNYKKGTLEATTVDGAGSVDIPNLSGTGMGANLIVQIMPTAGVLKPFIGFGAGLSQSKTKEVAYTVDSDALSNTTFQVKHQIGYVTAEGGLGIGMGRFLVQILGGYDYSVSNSSKLLMNDFITPAGLESGLTGLEGLEGISVLSVYDEAKFKDHSIMRAGSRLMFLAGRMDIGLSFMYKMSSKIKTKSFNQYGVIAAEKIEAASLVGKYDYTAMDVGLILGVKF